MQSPNKRKPSNVDRRYIERVASLPCSVCDAAGPSEVHEIKQGAWMLSVALCSSCHRSSTMGWHGQRRMWALKKMDELDALAVTLRRLL